MPESSFKAIGSFALESCDLFDITLADSMADRGHLEVGDELFSVDNLCCSFVADRPILVPTLAKLHQVLERLTKKQRPVEVKVFRGHGPSNRGPFLFCAPLNGVLLVKDQNHHCLFTVQIHADGLPLLGVRRLFIQSSLSNVPLAQYSKCNYRV